MSTCYCQEQECLCKQHCSHQEIWRRSKICQGPQAEGGIKSANLTLHEVASQFRELHDLQQQTDHDLRRVERESTTGRKKIARFYCGQKTGSNGRFANLRSSATRQFFRKESPALQKDLGVFGACRSSKRRLSLSPKQSCGNLVDVGHLLNVATSKGLP